MNGLVVQLHRYFMLACDPDKTVDEILDEFSVKYQNLVNESNDWTGKNNKVIVFVPSTLPPPSLFVTGYWTKIYSAS